MYEVEFPDGMIVRVPALRDVARLDRLLRQERCEPVGRLEAVEALDHWFRGWRDIELELDDWSARGSLKRAGVRTLGELAEVLTRGRQFRAVSFFESLWRGLEGFSPVLRRCVLELFDDNPAVRLIKRQGG